MAEPEPQQAPTPSLSLSKRTVVLAGAGIAGLAICLAVLLPGVSGAWPWQRGGDITVTGQVNCNDFDVASNSRFPFAKVEGFEIRGRSNVLRQAGHGYLATYEVTVPSGWVVEWSIKCSNERTWHDGKPFKVDGTAYGDSYRQTRNICRGGGPFEPCVPREFGSCLTALFTGVLPSVPTFEDALQVLAETYGSDNRRTDLQDCLQTLKDASPDLRIDTKPSSIPTVDPIDDSGIQEAEPLDPIDDWEEDSGTAAGVDDSGQSGGGQATVVISNKVTNGMSMREDTPAYLSSATRGFCRSNGCMVAGTEMGSGFELAVQCQIQGNRITNGEDSNSRDDANPSLFESSLWYGATWPDGQFGYISEVWTEQRGGLGLPGC